MRTSRSHETSRRRHTSPRSFALASLGVGALLAPLITVSATSPVQANSPQIVSVEGGVVTDYDGYRYHLFTHTGGVGESTDHTLTVEGASITADVLVVAGGGGGGRNRGGGGGAGGLVTKEVTLTPSSTAIPINVGGGGKGGSDPDGWKDGEASPGCQGKSSSFLDIPAVGGGGGGANSSGASWVLCDGSASSDYGLNGGDGGSGGGGSYPSGEGGTRTEGQGKSGGNGSSGNAGGGGGADAAGVTAASGANGDGGIGLTSTALTGMGIATGTGQLDDSGNMYYAGGGGGFRSGLGGLGGGGQHGQPGVVSTGGGGGACNSTGCTGGSPGGSGVVIVRYQVPQFTALSEPHTSDTQVTQSVTFGTSLAPIGLTGADSVELFSGDLPPGISLNGIADDAVQFQGTATAVGTFNFSLRAFQRDPADGPTVATTRAVSVTVSADVPTAPSELSVVDRDGDTLLSFTPPTSPGSDTVSFEATVDGGNSWVTLTADGGDWLLPDVDRTQQQSVQIRALNSAGASAPTSAVVFPLFMLNNDVFRVGGGGHGSDSFTRAASISANGQIVQPFYFDGKQDKWAKMTYGSAPFDFAIGFGEGNEPDQDTPYDATKNWTGATVYGTFQNPDPFQSPIPGSDSVTTENFSCDFEAGSSVCMGTGTIVASADFTLGGRTVTVINRYTLTANSKFLQVDTSVENPDGAPLPNVNVWVGTRDDWVGIGNSGGDGAQSGFGGRYRADLPQKFRGTIADNTFSPLSSASERATTLLLESLDGAGLFYSTSPGVNATIAPCCASLQAFADATSNALQSNTARGFENAITLNPAQSAIATPLLAGDFKPSDPDAEFFQNRRTDLRDAGYALQLPLGTIPAGESNSASWFLGGAAYSERSALLEAVSQAAPVPPPIAEDPSAPEAPPVTTQQPTPRSQVAPPTPGAAPTPAAPMVRRAPAPTATPTPPPVASGPVITGGQPPRPSNQPTATIGGVRQPVSQAPIGSTGVRITTGTIDVGLRVGNNSQGSVQTTPQGTPELAVIKGQATLISGSGVAPGSTLQVFMPLNGSNAVELGRLRANATGAFSGEAIVNTPVTQPPLPVGRQVLQILGVDEDGNQTVVNMTVNIVQPPPQPEINRDTQSVPSLGAGQSLVTEAGLPTSVQVNFLPESNQILIEGDGWTMGVSGAEGAGTDGEETADGVGVLTMVRDEPATLSGGGFMPLTRADVWLFSEPTLLGTVEIDENGEFNAVVNVDSNAVSVGAHTLQLQGVGDDGYVRAASIGVVVVDNPELTPAPTSSTSLSWLIFVFAAIILAAIVSLFVFLRRRRMA